MVIQPILFYRAVLGMEINWSKCIICQQDKSKPLKCPLDSLGAGNEVFYSSFLTDVLMHSQLIYILG